MSESIPGTRRGRSLSILQPPPPRLSTIGAITASLAQYDLDRARSTFALTAAEELVKTTVSLCPQCLDHAPAAVFRRARRVWMRRLCGKHGSSEAVVENDERYYFISNKDRAGRIYDQTRVFDIPSFALPGAAACCGEGETCDTPAPASGLIEQSFTEQLTNKTCTLLVEVTNACNLACTVCYSDSRGDRVVPYEQLTRHVDALAKQKGGLDSVQITGGEALLHPQFWELLAVLHGNPLIKKVYLPTNGILLSQRALAAKLQPYKSKLMVLLQFDGLDDETDRVMRKATPNRVRRRVIENLAELGIFMQLTMTLSSGINHDEVGAVRNLSTSMRRPEATITLERVAERAPPWAG